MQQMQREHSDMDMNGHRPQSPASAENAPSPSKRPRLEGGPMNGQQLAPNGRGQAQGIPGQPTPQALLMQNGLNRAMNPNQFQAFQQSGPAAQQKQMQVYAHNLAVHHTRSALTNQGMPNGMMNPANVMANPQTEMVSIPEGQVYPINGDYYGANGQMAQVRTGMQTPGGQHGNHALQDYQMQLMLLEQQNKRRLMMARQEQDSMARPDGQPQMPGQQLPPGTSPQGSRAGTSPNPNDQLKRGTPKMPQTGLPGSPSAADAMAQGRGSPASMNFPGGQMPPEMAGPQFFVKNMADGMAAPNGMRPPSSNPAFSTPQMGQPIQAGANRMPNGGWQPQQGAQGQPMAPQQSPATQPQSTGTPQERNAMPPPQAPPAPGANVGRTQPPSPQTAAPPTPQQGNKPAPKKKETKDSRKVCNRSSLVVNPPCHLILNANPSDRRRALLPLPLPPRRTRLPRHLPKQSIHQPLRRRPRSRPSIRTRSTRPVQMLRLVLRSSQRLPLHLPHLFNSRRTRRNSLSMN